MKKIVSALLLTISCHCFGHFSLAPKIRAMALQIDQPNKILLQRKSKDDHQFSSATRADFAQYLERLTAFDTKYERVQPLFFAYFNLVRGAALSYPENVHDYIDTLELLEANPTVYRRGLTDWFIKQAHVFDTFETMRQQGSALGIEHSPAYQSVLSLYVASVKTAFLEELIVLGEMTPSLSGLKEHVADIGTDRQNITSGIENDTELTPAVEQRRMKKRWADFRQDILRQARITRHFDAVNRPDVANSTPMITVNDRVITLQDYHHMFGRLPTSRFNALKKGNCERLALYLAMEDVFNAMGLKSTIVDNRINTTSNLIVAAMTLTEKLRGQWPALESHQDTLSYVLSLQAHPQILAVRDQIFSISSTEEGEQTDLNFFSKTEWKLERALAPMHSAHF